MLGRLVAYEQVVGLLDVLDDHLVHLVPPDTYRDVRHDAVQGYDGDLGRAAADVDDHVSRGLVDGEPHTDRCGDGFRDEVDIPRPRVLRRVGNGPPFDLGDSGRDTDDYPGAYEETLLLRFPDELTQHHLGDLEIGDDTVLHGPHRYDMIRGLPQHRLGLRSDRVDLLGLLIDRDDRGFVQHDAVALDVDQRVGRPEIDRYIVREVGGQAPKQYRTFLSARDEIPLPHAHETVTAYNDMIDEIESPSTRRISRNER